MTRFIAYTGLLLVTLALEPAVFCQTQPAAAQSDNEPTAINRLQAQAENLLREGKYDEALQLANQALKLAEQAASPDDTVTADSLFLVGRLHRITGDYGKAMTFSERALTLREKMLEANHPKLADSLNEMGILWDRKGEYAKGIGYLERALPIYEKTFGPDHPKVAACLNTYGAVLRNNGAFDRAESIQLRALAIYEKNNLLESREAATLLSNLGNLYFQKGDYAQAEAFLGRGLKVIETTLGKDHPEVSQILGRLALVARAKGNNSQAEPLYLRALEIREKNLGPEHPDVATSLNNLATFYSFTGAHAKAEPLYLRALAIREKTLGPEHRDLAGILNNLGIFYSIIGNYTRAEPLFLRSVAILEKSLGPEHPTLALSLSNLGAWYLFKGDYGKAEQYLQRALGVRQKVLGPNHHLVGTDCFKLSRCYQAFGDEAKAISFAQQSVDICEKALGPNHPEVAVNLGQLASLYLLKGDFTKAEPLFERALAISEKALGPDHTDTSFALDNLANLYRAKGEFAKAEPLFRRSLSIQEQVFGGDHPDSVTVLDHFTRMFEENGDFKQALELRIRTNEAAERDLVRNLLTGSERQKVLYLKKTADFPDRTISLHLQANPTNPVAAQAALTMILRRKGRALDAMTNAVATLRLTATGETEKLLDDYTTVANQLSDVVLRGPQKKKPAEHQAEVRRLEEQKEKLETEISRRSQQFKVQTAPISLAAVQKAIPAGGVLVEFASYVPWNPQTRQTADPRYAVYVLAPNGDLKWADLGPASVIEQAVTAFRTVVTNPGNKVARQVKPAAQALDRLVMKPVRALVGTTRHVLLSPDGVLNLIPFAALMDEKGKYLVERYNLTYLTSGRDLLRLQAKIPSQSPPLVIADPDYASGTGPRLLGQSYQPLARLTATHQEGEQIKNILPDARLEMERTATETTLKQVRRPRFLHIATHGYFLADAPANPVIGAVSTRILERDDEQPVDVEKIRQSNGLLRSWLFFAGANHGGDQENDGTLTALEAAQLDLWGTRLVVLSACETGVGEAKTGEGVYGLRRALVLAGSEAQMMSLWSVSDEGTRELMVDYYRRLKAGTGRSEALRQVQMEFLKNPKRQHPYYWASFIQSGAWTGLEETP
ncbi:MAG: CHAT domain-containing protein [Blastocatellia bacterium]|nr:CHAT domain-containing protein [Blastocatellia bacterium]